MSNYDKLKSWMKKGWLKMSDGVYSFLDSQKRTKKLPLT